MQTLRAFAFLALALFSLATQAASSSGIWSSVEGYYLLMMEQSSTGTMVVLAVSPSLKTGLTLTGSRSGDVINLQSLDGKLSASLTLNGTSYTGTYTSGGASLALSGQLLMAYSGSANDGIWQKNDGSPRYLISLTVQSAGTQFMLLADVTNPASASVGYDVSIGGVQTLGTYPSYGGLSLVTGNAVDLVFKGGAPALGSYSIMTVTRPFATVEQFDVTRIFSFN